MGTFCGRFAQILQTSRTLWIMGARKSGFSSSAAQQQGEHLFFSSGVLHPRGAWTRGAGFEAVGGKRSAFVPPSPAASQALQGSSVSCGLRALPAWCAQNAQRGRDPVGAEAGPCGPRGGKAQAQRGLGEGALGWESGAGVPSLPLTHRPRALGLARAPLRAAVSLSVQWG